MSKKLLQDELDRMTDLDLKMIKARIDQIHAELNKSESIHDAIPALEDAADLLEVLSDQIFGNKEKKRS